MSIHLFCSMDIFKVCGHKVVSVASLLLTVFRSLTMVCFVCLQCRYITEPLGGEKFVSCSSVLSALCHLHNRCQMLKQLTQPASGLNLQRISTNGKKTLDWLKVATALDSRFMNLRYRPCEETLDVWKKLSEMTDIEPTPPYMKWCQSHQRKRRYI